MSNLKRISALMLAVALLAALLCGCNSGNEDNTADSTPSTTTVPTDPPVIIPSFTTKPADNGKVTYTVTVLDQNNNPVEGVTIQFCDEENCKMPVVTDANGVVSQSYAPSVYHITLIELPAGYTAEETEFYFGEATDLTVVVAAQ